VYVRVRTFMFLSVVGCVWHGVWHDACVCIRFVRLCLCVLLGACFCVFLFFVWTDKEKITSIEELKMIWSGKLLDNSKSFAELKIPTGNQVGCVCAYVCTYSTVYV